MYIQMKFIACLQCEYVYFAVDLFCENVTPVQFLVAVCISILSFFLHLKEYML